MRGMDLYSLLQTEPVEVPDLPLPTVPDWDRQVETASRLCRLIDRHLDYESRHRMLAARRDFRPKHLCPEQRVQLLSDLSAASRR